MDPQQGHGRALLRSEPERVTVAPEDVYVFVVTERLPFGRDFCRCGRRPLELSWDRLEQFLAESKASMSV
jgi:hypothetical protein